MKRTISGVLKLFVPLGIIIWLSHSCYTSKPAVDTKDLSYIYNPVKSSLNPRYGIFNQSDNNSVLSVKFFKNDLYFNEANPKGVPMALLYVSVQVFNLSQGKTLVDTAFYNLDIVREESRQEYLYHIPLKVESGFDYVAEIKVLDRIRKAMTHSFVPFSTRSENNRYNYYARGHFLHNELLNPVVRKNEYLNLIYLRKNIDTLFISYFQPYEGVPYPPNMILPERTINPEPDTTIGLHYSDTLPVMLPKKGLYFCTNSKKITEGYTLMNFGISFPAMTTPEEMIEPLAYLASDEELNDLRHSLKPKLALDDFWVKCGGNIDKSRELIRIYYTRALFANLYFTSYREGWRTDRGMIYLIYGPPDKLYKASGEENWGYKKEEIKSSWGTRYTVKEDYLFFNFKKKDNKFTDNDFYLSRSETIVTYWDKAVMNWRKGVVFRLDNPAND
jgi:GWxTD domain-containing protein